MCWCTTALYLLFFTIIYLAIILPLPANAKLGGYIWSQSTSQQESTSSELTDANDDHPHTAYTYRKNVANVAPVQEHWSNPIRRLIGSNCIQIQRGSIPKYYDCDGCRIEEATACVNDMRWNKSGNVFTLCDMNSIMQKESAANCCPRTNSKGKLQYVGSAYPDAIHCMEYVGCQGLTLYTDLKQECESLCPPGQYSDSSGVPLCVAFYNASYRLSGGAAAVFFTMVVGSLMTIFFSWYS